MEAHDLEVDRKRRAIRELLKLEFPPGDSGTPDEQERRSQELESKSLEELQSRLVEKWYGAEGDEIPRDCAIADSLSLLDLVRLCVEDEQFAPFIEQLWNVQPGGVLSRTLADSEGRYPRGLAIYLFDTLARNRSLPIVDQAGNALDPSEMPASIVDGLKNTYVRKVDFREFCETKKLPLPDKWFQKTDDGSAKPELEADFGKPTGPATRSRQIAKEDRRTHLQKFVDRVYEAGADANHDWAGRRGPLPFSKKDVLTVFVEQYPQHEGISQSTMKDDLKDITVTFARGKRSNQADFLRKLLGGERK